MRFGYGHRDNRVYLDARVIYFEVHYTAQLNTCARSTLVRRCERPCPVPVFVGVSWAEEGLIWLEQMRIVLIPTTRPLHVHASGIFPTDTAADMVQMCIIEVICNWSSRRGVLLQAHRKYKNGYASPEEAWLLLHFDWERKVL